MWVRFPPWAPIDNLSVNMKREQNNCRHDYKSAIKVGNIDYMCQLCGKLLDPLEWFIMNSFEFVDSGGEVAGSARKVIKKRSGKKVSTRKNYLPKSSKCLK